MLISWSLFNIIIIIVVYLITRVFQVERVEFGEYLWINGSKFPARRFPFRKDTINGSISGNEIVS